MKSIVTDKIAFVYFLQAHLLKVHWVVAGVSAVLLVGASVGMDKAQLLHLLLLAVCLLLPLVVSNSLKSRSGSPMANAAIGP